MGGPTSSPRIRPLPATLSNQIAAGEVVERPASALKEFLENSLDAQATRLEIEVEKGGVGLIVVRDDGTGIEREDLRLALSRHATSKIATLEDLEAVRTLGFRGEALPSIASVARLELTSRSAASEVGWRVDSRDEDAEPQPVAHPLGTTVSLRDLFYNTPARRKFLRTEKTEQRHLEDTVRRIALGRLDVGLSFKSNARAVWLLPGARSEPERLRRLAKLCGRGFCENALSIEFEAPGMRLAGWIAAPSFERHRADLQYFFLNARPIRDKVVTHALRQAYGDRLASGCHPAFVLYLDVEPGAVDVNVHPAKHEVRFRESRLVHDFLVRSLGQALGAALSPGLDLAPSPSVAGSSPPPAAMGHARAPRVEEELQRYAALGGLRKMSPGEAGEPSAGAHFGALLGCVHDRFILTRTEEGIALIDLALALERVILHRLETGLAAGTFRSRPLLVPAAVRLEEAKVGLLEGVAERLLESGVDVRASGPDTVSLRELPAALEQVDAEKLVAELCAWASAAPGPDRASLLRLLAGHGARRMPAPSDAQSARSLLADLEACLGDGGDPSPFSVRLSVAELERLVRR